MYNLAFLFSLMHWAWCHQIQLVDNGYSGILVAIDSDVPEIRNQTIISAIKILFSAVSKYMYESFRNRTYVSDVDVLIPPTWALQPWMERSSTAMFQTADIIIEPDGPVVEPFLFMRNIECGVGGGKIVLTETFMNKANNLALYGFDADPGRTFVKLWSQFRYGIFDEHGYVADSSYPYFYFDEDAGMPMPTSCSTALMLFGKTVDVRTGVKCESEDDLLNGGYCEYELSHYYDKTTSSINYAPYFSPITQFCDDTRENRHNYKAPTKQNAYCNYQSTWDVIMSHTDFQNGRNPSRNIEDVTPTIRFLYTTQRHFVLAYDISNSADEGKINWFRQALFKFINYEVAFGTSIGVVVFDINATISLNMTTIKTDADKKAVISAIWNSDSEHSCIGCGLLQSLNLLASTNESNGGVVVVISDGYENVDSPSIANASLQIIDSGVQLNWIAFGNYLGSDLVGLVTQSRGQIYFVGPDQSLAAASVMASSLFAITAGDQQRLKITVKDKMVLPTDDSGVRVGNFLIDSAIGPDTVITFMYDEDFHPPPDVAITPPNSTLLNQTQITSSQTISNDCSIIGMTFSTAQIGTWTYTISAANELNVSITVSSKVRKHFQEVIIMGWTNVGFMEVDSVDRPVMLFASVRIGPYPVLNATVNAIVTGPCQLNNVVNLMDRGIAPDVQRNDGIYSRYITQFCGRGHYGVRIDVGGSSLAGTQKLILIDDSGQLLTSPVEPFQRSVTSGDFTVTNDITTEDDVQPPARVLDLAITQRSSEDISYVALLQWSAPGDDYDFGTASSYELKYSCNISLVRAPGFENNTRLVTNQMVIGGSMTPLAAGSAQSILVQFPRHYNIYYVALAALDDAGNRSPASNVVQAVFLAKCQTVGQTFRDVDDCSEYYVCESVGADPTKMHCASGLCYNPALDICNWPNPNAAFSTTGSTATPND